MDHPTAVTSAATKHWSNYVATLRLAEHAHRLQEVRPTVRPVRSPTTDPLAIVHTACCNLYQSRERPWHSINMDFIEQLPAYNGFTTILEVIDHLSKEGVFIPTMDTIAAPDVAGAFVPHMFSKRGIPHHVFFDRVSEFTSHLFRSLGSLLRMRLHFTSGHHPSASSQVERSTAPWKLRSPVLVRTASSVENVSMGGGNCGKGDGCGLGRG